MTACGRFSREPRLSFWCLCSHNSAMIFKWACQTYKSSKNTNIHHQNLYILHCKFWLTQSSKNVWHLIFHLGVLTFKVEFYWLAAMKCTKIGPLSSNPSGTEGQLVCFFPSFSIFLVSRWICQCRPTPIVRISPFRNSFNAHTPNNRIKQWSLQVKLCLFPSWQIDGENV